MYSRPLPHRHPFSDFFWGEGAAVHRLSEMANRPSNCPSKLMDKVRRIVHSKLKLFHFQIKTYYLSEANHQTDPICCNFCMVLSMFFRLVLTRGTVGVRSSGSRLKSECTDNFSSEPDLWLLRHTDEPQRGRNSCLWLQSRSVLSSFGVVLMSCRVNFHLVRSALQYSVCRI